MRKLTTEKIALIQERHARGATYGELASAFKVSEGSVANALKATRVSPGRKGSPTSAPVDTIAGGVSRPTEKPAAAARAPLSEPDEPMTREDLVSFLSSQARSLKAEIETATEPAMRAGLNRQLVMVQTLLQRTLPPTPLDPSVGVFVDAGEMRLLGEQVSELLHGMIELVVEDAAVGPPCLTCHRPMPPNARRSL